MRGKDVVFAPFFGVPAATITATHHLARLSGAEVIPFFHRRLDDGGYAIRLEAPLADFPSADAVTIRRASTPASNAWCARRRRSTFGCTSASRRARPERRASTESRCGRHRVMRCRFAKRARTLTAVREGRSMGFLIVVACCVAGLIVGGIVRRCVAGGLRLLRRHRVRHRVRAFAHVVGADRGAETQTSKRQACTRAATEARRCDATNARRAAGPSPASRRPFAARTPAQPSAPAPAPIIDSAARRAAVPLRRQAASSSAAPQVPPPAARSAPPPPNAMR